MRTCIPQQSWGGRGGGGVTLDMRAWLSACVRPCFAYVCVCFVGGRVHIISVRALVYKLGAACAPVLGSLRGMSRFGLSPLTCMLLRLEGNTCGLLPPPSRGRFFNSGHGPESEVPPS